MTDLREARRLALAAGEVGAWELNLVSGAAEWSREMYALFGLKPGTPPLPYQRWLAECVHPEDRARVDSEFKAILPSRRSAFQGEFRVVHPRLGVRWILSRGHVARARGGKPLRIAGINLDITRVKRVEETQRLLLGELNHRIKNMLATVLSLANQTIRESATLHDFQKAFVGRVRALSATQAALSRNNWVGVALSDIVATETAPYAKRGGGNFQAAGCDITLTPRAALSMALTLHELTTNAAKHGALSRPEGRVRLRWKLEDGEGGRTLVLKWTESGGPEVKPPTRAGFGRRLIEQGAAYELGAATTLDFRRNGVRCRIAVPAEKALAQKPADAK